MKKRRFGPRERRPVSHKVCIVALWLQMLFGVTVTLPFFPDMGHGLMAGLLLFLLLVWWIGKDTRGGRITARLLTGIAYAFGGIPLLVVATYTREELLTQFVPGLVLFSLPLLLWLSPVVGIMSLQKGKYDRFVALFTQGWIVTDLVLALALVPEALPWSFGDNTAVRFILCVLVGFATVTLSLCAFRRQRQEKPTRGTTLSLEE